MIRRPPRSTRTDTLFPYTPLFRSGLRARWLFVAIPDRSGRRGRSPDLRIPAPCVPLFAGLAPDVDREVLERHRQRAAAQPARPQPLRDPLRRRVAGVDAVDDVVPAQVLEGPVDGSGARFRCVALAPGTRVERIADLVARPAFRLPRPDLPHPQATGLLDHAEHPETLHHPRPWLPEDAAPGLRARHTPADEAGGVRIALHPGDTVEIPDRWGGRRVVKACVRRCSSRWCPDHAKNKR